VDTNIFKRIIPVIAFIIFLTPIITYPLLDLEQKKINEQLLAQELAEKQAEKIAQDRNYLLGKFDPSKNENFTVIPTEYSISGYKMYLRKETLDAFLKMAEAAEKEQIILKIASATRNFIYQKGIWNNKWTGIMLVDGKNLNTTVPNELQKFIKILEYSAAPGTSRHHWGTDIDINDATPPYFDSEKGEKEYAWLTKNAPLFGFCQPYDLKDNNRETGYNEEKWHWSYKPLAKDFTQEYKNIIKESDISGFDGDKYISNFDLINDYVLDINPDCL